MILMQCEKTTQCDLQLLGHARSIPPSGWYIFELEDIEDDQYNHRVENDNCPECLHTEPPEGVAQLHKQQITRLNKINKNKQE